MVLFDVWKTFLSLLLWFNMQLESILTKPFYDYVPVASLALLITKY